MMLDLDIESGWKLVLKEEFSKGYFLNIERFLTEEKKMGKIIYPEGKDIFNAFNLTPFDNVKVVIVGQDPYYGIGQSHGICFSVKKGVVIPPSLKNIFKELNRDIGCKVPNHGCLTDWTKQGVFLLNSILTVEHKNPTTHSNIGRQELTNIVIRKLSERKSGLVFLLWGSYAQNKKILIDQNKHFILETTHPSPLSAYRGFFGSNIFSKTNNILVTQGKKQIDWCVL